MQCGSVLRRPLLQVDRHQRTGDEYYRERGPGFQESLQPDVLSGKEQPERQHDHVPVCVLLVLHQREGHPHMGVTVVAKQVMHPRSVHHRRLRDALVPLDQATVHEARLQLQVPGRSAEAHVVFGHKVRPGKVPDHSVGHGDAHVADEGKEPGQHRDRCPHDAERVLVGGKVDRSGHRRRIVGTLAREPSAPVHPSGISFSFRDRTGFCCAGIFRFVFSSGAECKQTFRHRV